MAKRKIPKEVYKDIQPQFNKVVAYSQNADLDLICSDRTFDAWATNKEWFYMVLGDQLIKECGYVTTGLSAEQKQIEFNNFKQMVTRSNHFSSLYGKRLYDFLEKITAEEFYNNSISGIVQIYNSDGEVKILGAGTKVLRSFKHFFPSDLEHITRFFQDKASELIQNDKISGVLCLSIHPLDFLSLSENASNWRSCHALDGEYRAGNLSYMMDSSTLIAYIKSPEEKEIHRFPFLWNDKKWRNLLFFDRYHCNIMAGRPYPKASMEALDLVLEEIRKLDDCSYFTNHWNYNKVCGIKFETYDPDTQQLTTREPTPEDNINLFTYDKNRFIYDEGILYDVSKLVWKKDEEFCHYNDLLYSSTYFPYWTRGSSYSYFGREDFQIGHEVYCLYDETHIISKDSSERLICSDCLDTREHERTCWWCGSTYDEDDGYYIEARDEEICPYCFHHHVTVCSKCEEREMTEYSYINENNEVICMHCYEELPEEEKTLWHQHP